MTRIISKELCNGCCACANICPKNCINMIHDDNGFWYPNININNCINCGLCEQTCPITNKPLVNMKKETEAFAAVNNDDTIRHKSSSGGVFTIIAQEIIAQGGVVFGAAFAEDFKSVNHIYIDKECDLDKLRGSKYVQSKIGRTYCQAKEFLDEGRKVLFTGTPCQIGGLYSFLNKQYDNLFTQDIVCHGVPSPMVWKKYLEEREKKAASITDNVSFRYKKYGWKKYYILIRFKNGKKYQKFFREDSYMRAFLANATLRQSCFKCFFKGINRSADITLADFWGVQNILPEIDDDKGVSLLLVHSDNGLKLLESIKQHAHIQSVSIDTVSRYNPSAVQSATVCNCREEYIKNAIDRYSDRLINRYYKVSLKMRMKNYYRKLKSRISHIKNDNLR